jgi:hypothetical protein
MFQGEISHVQMTRHLSLKDYPFSSLLRHVKGINLLSCLVRYGDGALTIGYEIIRKDVEFCDVETKRKKERLCPKS